MSALSVLREAISKLDDAETALLHARNAYRVAKRENWHYQTIDNEFEKIGDAKTTLEHILAQEERAAMEAQNERIG
jgi:hypothetical protein